MLSSMNILPQCCWQFNLTAYRSMPEFHQYSLFGSGFNHFAKSIHMSLKNKMLLIKVCLQFLVKQSCSVKRVPISLHHTYTDTCRPWTNAIWFVIWQVPILYILCAHMQSAFHKRSCLDPAVIATIFVIFFWSPELPCILLLYPFSALLMSIHFNFAQSHLDTACPSSTLLCVIFCFTSMMNKL